MLRRIWNKVRRLMEARPDRVFALRPPLPLPDGRTENQLLAFLLSVCPVKAPAEEMTRYCTHDFRRFLYTWGLARNCTGQALELGANPYFTTMLLTRFTALQLTLANYFGPHSDKVGVQEVHHRDFATQQPASTRLTFHHFNVEAEPFPFADAGFDVVLFCEILEHLQLDPLAVFAQIKRVLRPDGVLILTTPNVARLENRARLLAGANIYDPYSGYGAYGRHNREYTRDELERLLLHAGFAMETCFSADVHENLANHYCPLSTYQAALQQDDDLGQYLFIRARNSLPAQKGRPAWLYRSWPAGD